MIDPKSSTEALLRRFVPNAPTRSSQTIAERIAHWSDVANDPQRYTDGDSSRYAISQRRKVALQSLRKLLTDHPEIAAEIAEKREAEVAG